MVGLLGGQPAQQFARQDWSRQDSQGCQVVEDWLQLHGWRKKRRVVGVRQRIRNGMARGRRVDSKQLTLDRSGPSVYEGERRWEYAVLFTSVHRAGDCRGGAHVSWRAARSQLVCHPRAAGGRANAKAGAAAPAKAAITPTHSR